MGRPYRTKHPDMVSERQKIVRATHPEYEQNPRRKAKKVSYQAARRAREVGVGGSHTQEEWEALCATHGGACAWCGCTDKPLTRDHIVPLSRGGSHDITNIQPLCRRCAEEARGR
jgi:5-methylcytosine-specific restriction endonuclease McrA